MANVDISELDLGSQAQIDAAYIEGDDGVDTFKIKLIKNKYDATIAPTVNNDITDGYTVGSKWVDITADNSYILENNTAGEANWLQTNADVGESVATTTTRGTAFLRSEVRVFNGTDSDHDMDFTTGIVTLADGGGDVSMSSLTKQIDATWAAGTAAGGRASGVALSNDTTYHCFALSNASGSSTDFGFDTSVSAANLLADATVISAGLTDYKRVCSVITNGTANIMNGKFYFSNDSSYTFIHDVIISDFDENNPGTLIRTKALTVPLGLAVYANYYLIIKDLGTAATTHVYVFDGFQSDTAASASVRQIETSGNGVPNSSYFSTIVNPSNASMNYRISTSSTDHYIFGRTVGWTDTFSTN